MIEEPGDELGLFIDRQDFDEYGGRIVKESPYITATYYESCKPYTLFTCQPLGMRVNYSPCQKTTLKST